MNNDHPPPWSRCHPCFLGSGHHKGSLCPWFLPSALILYPAVRFISWCAFGSFHDQVQEHSLVLNRWQMKCCRLVLTKETLPFFHLVFSLFPNTNPSLWSDHYNSWCPGLLVPSLQAGSIHGAVVSPTLSFRSTYSPWWFFLQCHLGYHVQHFP